MIKNVARVNRFIICQPKRHKLGRFPVEVRRLLVIHTAENVKIAVIRTSKTSEPNIRRTVKALFSINGPFSRMNS